MSAELEATVLEFFKTWECEHLDAARADEVVEFLAPDARYHVFAWHGPFVGREAIRDELLRKAPFYTDNHYKILTIASTGNTVLVQRRDCVTMFGKAARFNVVGVFEFDTHGKITCWRDYLDSAEIGAKVRSDVPERAVAGATRTEED